MPFIFFCHDGIKTQTALKYTPMPIVNTFVWGNAIKTSKERIRKQLDELWQYAQNVAAAEMPDRDPADFEKIER